MGATGNTANLWFEDKEELFLGVLITNLTNRYEQLTGTLFFYIDYIIESI